VEAGGCVFNCDKDAECSRDQLCDITRRICITSVGKECKSVTVPCDPILGTCTEGEKIALQMCDSANHYCDGDICRRKMGTSCDVQSHCGEYSKEP